MSYPVPAKPHPWSVQVEFLNGVVIDGMSDEDIFDRWALVAAWTDPSALHDRDDWMERVLDRARVFYGARLDGVDPFSDPADILEALAAERCLILRRK